PAPTVTMLVGSTDEVRPGFLQMSVALVMMAVAALAAFFTGKVTMNVWPRLHVDCLIGVRICRLGVVWTVTVSGPVRWGLRRGASSAVPGGNWVARCAGGAGPLISGSARPVLSSIADAVPVVICSLPGTLALMLVTSPLPELCPPRSCRFVVIGVIVA